MPFSSSKTGRTDLRETDVQQPKVTSTLWTCSSSRAFSANSGQLEAGSTTTASSLRPSRPPLLLAYSTIISAVSRSAVSLIAMVPEREWRTPTLIGAPWPKAGWIIGAAKLAPRPASAARRVRVRDVVVIRLSFLIKAWRHAPDHPRGCAAPRTVSEMHATLADTP